MAELAHAWILKRLILGFRVEGWSGRVADTRLDDRIRHRDVPDDRVHGIDSPRELISLLGDLLPRYAGRHGGIRRKR
jgi:hypothetical protein